MVTTSENVELKYELVESEPSLLRYVATEKLSDGNYTALTAHRWLSLLNLSPDLVSQFNEIIKNCHLKAFFFETKGVSLESAKNKSFEFVLVESLHLHDFADSLQNGSPFREKINCGSRVGCVFNNLGGDSVLIAPALQSSSTNVYGHLGAFVRRAPPTQIVPFWQLALETLLKTLQDNPAKTYWFSTDGRGVAWLHMRIDPNPKYYAYKAFIKEY